jgi:hypothetical protein
MQKVVQAIPARRSMNAAAAVREVTREASRGVGAGKAATTARRWQAGQVSMAGTRVLFWGSMAVISWTVCTLIVAVQGSWGVLGPRRVQVGQGSP